MQRNNQHTRAGQATTVDLDPLATARRDVSAAFGENTPPEKATWALSILTMNSTTWLSAKDYILKTSAAVILLQAHHLLKKDIQAVSQRCLRNGYKSLWD